MKTQDLQVIRGAAVKALNALTPGLRLAGETLPVNERDQIALAYYEAVLSHLNGLGAIKEGWIEKNAISWVEADSNPESDDYE